MRLSANSRDTGYFLINQLLDELEDVCGGGNRDKVEARLSAVLSLYDIKPKKPAAGHPDLLDKVEQFISAKKLEGYSPVTLGSYLLDLKIFAESLPKPAHEIDTQDIRHYLSGFEHLKPSSVAKKLSVLKSFFGWQVEEEMINKDPTRKIKQPKKEQRVPKALTLPELEMLREHCETLRERAFLEVFYATGGRLDEIYKLDKNDINWQDRSLTVIGKGNKEREVYLSVRVDYHLRKYLDSRNDACVALFATIRKPIRRLSKRQIQKDIKNIAARAGLEKKVHPHVLRHTFATLLLNNGAELSEVQHLLGHSSPLATQTYINVTDQKKKQAHRKYLIQ